MRQQTLQEETQRALQEVDRCVAHLAWCLDRQGDSAHADWLRSWVHDLIWDILPLPARSKREDLMTAREGRGKDNEAANGPTE